MSDEVVVNKTVPIRIHKAKAIDWLKKFYGVPPYNGMNPCKGDGIYASSIEKEFGCTIDELKEATGFQDILDKWEEAQDPANF